MTLLKVLSAPLSRPLPCKAFYDLVGDTLSVGIKQRGKFKRSIDGEEFSFDLTRDGKLLNIDVWLPRNVWETEKAIHPPEDTDLEMVRFASTDAEVDAPHFLTNEARSLLYLQFSRQRVARFLAPAKPLIFELNSQNDLVGLWILEIEDDINFQKEGLWRQSVRAV